MVPISCDICPLLPFDNCPIPSKWCSESVLQLHSYSDSRDFDNECSDADEGVVCEKCNSQPCDWSKYGPEIILHLNNNYAGYFMDEDGKVGYKLTNHL